MPIALAPFDPARDFVAQTSFRADGTIWMRKRPFDKFRVNLRVLRQLYESRKIAYDDGTTVEDEEPIAPPGDESPEEKHEDDIETTGAAAQDEGAPTEAEGAEAASGGSATAAPASVDRETLIKRLVKRYNHDGLFQKASGLAGVSKGQTKAEIAGALVDAGRVGDDGAA